MKYLILLAVLSGLVSCSNQPSNTTPPDTTINKEPADTSGGGNKTPVTGDNGPGNNTGQDTKDVQPPVTDDKPKPHDYTPNKDDLDDTARENSTKQDPQKEIKKTPVKVYTGVKEVLDDTALERSKQQINPSIKSKKN